jgi:triosephosphate isomerase (TIM)
MGVIRMRKQFIIGNWKMNGSKLLVKELLTACKSVCENPLNAVQMVVCPPYVFLNQAQIVLQHSAIAWAGQNMASEKEGAYTGEVSAAMLHEFGCRYVLLGHSERRTYFGETDEQITKKFKLAIAVGIIPVLCVGETYEQRQEEQTEAILKTQLKGVMALAEAKSAAWILAYEPVWAIGTGVSASPEQAQDVHQFLRRQLASCDSHLAEELPILYGGSVKPDTAKALFCMPDIDGGLIGGASLHAREFLKIYEDCVSLASCSLG